MSARFFRTPIAAATLLVGIALPPTAGAKVFVFDFDDTAPAGQLSLAALPPSPVGAISDPGNRLDPQIAAQAQRDLAAGDPTIPVFLLVSDKALPPATTEAQFANEILRRWDAAERNLSGLVFTIPEPLPSIHVAIGGRALAAADVSALREIGSKALAAMPSQAAFGDAAATAAYELKRRLADATLSGTQPLAAPVDNASRPESAGAVSDPPATQDAPSSRWEALSRTLNWQAIRVWSSILGGLLVSVCTLLLYRRYRSRRDLRFPEHLPRKRFSAPFAGGSNAQITYRP